ncbi:MAG TPA: Ig-like domain-containing protein, partial [Candidatus Thermoplasmatota archaeon]|nr:Ig-like domain-containing protein [Candidatus Thermoplasmatota archaeon]
GEYSGDSNYNPSTDASDGECFTVTAAESSTDTTPTLASIVLGQSNSDQVTVTGVPGVTPTGSVTFFLCGPGELTDGVCSSGGSFVSTEDLVNGAATSQAATPDSTGTWCFRGEYSGDSNYNPSSDASEGECFTVTAAESSTDTTPADAAIVLGGSNSDQVTVAGVPGVTPTGTVTFYVCSPSQLTNGVCSSGGSLVSTEALVDGAAASDTFTPTSAGTWCFRGEYSGDANYEPSSDSSAGECFTVAKADSSSATTPGSATVPLGGSNTDRITVTGVPGVTPTGLVDFFVCSPGELTDNVCSAGGTFVSNETLSNGQATSDPFTPVGAGRWCFRGAYRGDGNYNPSSDSSAAECFTVLRGNATLATASAPGGDVFPGTQVKDDATLTGLAGQPTPTGTVRYFLCEPSQVTNAGCPSGGQQVGGAGALVNGQATSDAFSATLVGRHCWRAEYSGDANYVAAAHTNNASECFRVVRYQIGLTTTSTPTGGNVGLGSETYDQAFLTGAPGIAAPTGAVAFFLCQPADVNGNGCEAPKGTQVGPAVDVGDSTVTSGISNATTTVGKYCWRAAYSGDVNYEPKTHTNAGSECFTTIKGDICTERPDDPLCALVGPASCVAVGADVRVRNNILVAEELETTYAPSYANATGADGRVHGDAHTASLDVGPADLLHSGTVETHCDTGASPTFADACGEATTENLTIDLYAIDVPVRLDALLLRENGCTDSGRGGDNQGLVLDLRVDVMGAHMAVPVGPGPTVVDLPPYVVLRINEEYQDVKFGCNRHHGSVLHLFVQDPLRDRVEVIVDWVSTMACPIPFPDFPPGYGPAPYPTPPGPIGDVVSTPGGEGMLGPALPVLGPPAPSFGAAAPAALAAGESACEAAAVVVRAAPLGDVGALDLRVAPSAATATPAAGDGHGQAYVAGADADPFVLVHATALASHCDAASGSEASRAAGEASVANLTVDLNPAGLDIVIEATLLRNRGASGSEGGASSDANIADLRVHVLGVDVPVSVTPAEPNTIVPLGDLGYLALNEQSSAAGACSNQHSSAVRLVVFQPGTLDVLAEVIVSDVATQAC